jgi:hypothetical protein
MFSCPVLSCVALQQQPQQHEWAGQPATKQQQQQHEEPAEVAVAAAGLPQDHAAAEELQQLKSCVVCMDAPRSVLLLPCKHLALYESCAQQLQQRRAGGDEGIIILL